MNGILRLFFSQRRGDANKTDQRFEDVFLNSDHNFSANSAPLREILFLAEA